MGLYCVADGRYFLHRYRFVPFDRERNGNHHHRRLWEPGVDHYPLKCILFTELCLVDPGHRLEVQPSWPIFLRRHHTARNYWECLVSVNNFLGITLPGLDRQIPQNLLHYLLGINGISDCSSHRDNHRCMLQLREGTTRPTNQSSLQVGSLKPKWVREALERDARREACRDTIRSWG